MLSVKITGAPRCRAIRRSRRRKHRHTYRHGFRHAGCHKYPGRQCRQPSFYTSHANPFPPVTGLNLITTVPGRFYSRKTIILKICIPAMYIYTSAPIGSTTGTISRWHLPYPRTITASNALPCLLHPAGLCMVYYLLSNGMALIFHTDPGFFLLASRIMPFLKFLKNFVNWVYYTYFTTSCQFYRV